MVITVVAIVIIIRSNHTSQSGSWQKQTADPRGHRPDWEGAVRNLVREGLWEVPTGVVALGTAVTHCPTAQQEGRQPLSPSTLSSATGSSHWLNSTGAQMPGEPVQ